MALTEVQINAIKLVIFGDHSIDPPTKGLNDYVNEILDARLSVESVLNIHDDIIHASGNAVMLEVVNKAKLQAKTASDNLSVLLT